MAIPARPALPDLDVSPALRAVILGGAGLLGAVTLLALIGLVLTQTEEVFTWSGYWQQVVSGLAQGAIFASLALALVIAFVGGAAIERTIIRPVEHRPDIVIVIVTIGMLIALNGLSGWIWNPEIKAFDTPFSNGTTEIGGVVISYQDLGVLGVCLATVVLIWAFFRFTTLGLVMRAVANSQDASRLLGVRVGWMLALGWGLAAVLGAVAGMMAAPTLFLDPNLMLVVLIYSFAAAVLGGIDSPGGAVVGGLILGVLINILGTYVDFIGGELRLPAALVVLLIVLLIRPQGLFGHKVVRRV